MINSSKQIFVNRTLNMNIIKMIGFDMDYTLVTYNVPAFEAKAYSIMQEKLIKNYGYPEEIRKFEFDKDFVIRGLVIDTESGNFMKVNRYGYVRSASHGTRFMTFEEQKEKFGLYCIDLTDPRYSIAHTLFSKAEGCLFAQLVDFFDEKQENPNYKKIFSEISVCLNEAHQETELKGDVVNNPEKYIIPNKRIVDALLKFKRFGKKLALITNSDFTYSNKVMDYCYGKYLKTSWTKLFDIIVVTSNKPEFFTGHNRFLKVDPETGLLSNFFGSLEWNNIYQGGNAKVFEKDLGIEPAEILYLGDHITGDVVSLKKTIGWRTGLVVQELANEVPILEKTQEIHKTIARKMEEKEKLEDISLEYREKLWLKQNVKANRTKWEEIKEKMIQLDDELKQLITDSQKGFNPYWGEVMRAGNELSRFATLVERYACIYMSGIDCLSYYSPFKYFRSKRRLLAHDPK